MMSVTTALTVPAQAAASQPSPAGDPVVTSKETASPDAAGQSSSPSPGSQSPVSSNEAFAAYYYNEATGLALDSNEQGHVYTMEKNYGTYQSWGAIDLGDGTYYIQNVKTGRCLDTTNKNVYTLYCVGSPEQRWRFKYTSTATMLQNNKNGECLDSNWYGNVYTNPCNENNTYQLWQRH